MSRSDIGIGGFSYRSLIALTWPQFMMMLFQMGIGFVDVYVAGRIGAQVQAAMGMVLQSLFVFLVIGTTTSSGLLATVGQSVGAGKRDRALRYAGLGIGLGLSLCFVLIFCIYFFRLPLLNAMMVPESIQPIGLYFLNVILVSLPAHYLLIITSAIFRAHRKV